MPLFDDDLDDVEDLVTQQERDRVRQQRAYEAVHDPRILDDIEVTLPPRADYADPYIDPFADDGSE